MMEWIVTSTAMILIVIALRGLLKGKISLKLQYGLWALVLVRLLLPFSIVDSAISITNILSAPVIQNTDEALADYRESYEAIRQNSAQQGQEVTDDDIRLQVQQQLYNKAYSQIEKEYTQSGAAVTVDRIQTEAQQQVQVISLTAVITEALPYFWAAGMIAVAVVLTGSNLHFWWKLRQSRKPLEISGVPLNTYLTDYVATPCLFGLAKPDIYLTGEVLTDSQMRRHVLAHEMSHYRQGDHIWSVLRCVCLVLHWYNPLVWVAAVLSKKDAELACDEATIKTLGETERTAYGRTLIGMTCVRRDPRSLMLTATTMLGTKKTLKERIALIAKKPKTALYTLIACVLVAAIAVGCTFTGAPTEPKETDPVTEPTGEPTDAPTSEPTIAPTEARTPQKLLEQCRQALEELQSRDSYELIQKVTDENPDAMLAFDTARYIHNGNDWIHIKESADSTQMYLQLGTRQYIKYITPSMAEEDQVYTTWTEADLSADPFASHCWLMTLEWNADTVVFDKEEIDGNEQMIFLYTDIADGGGSTQMIFRFRVDTGALLSVTRNIDETDYLYTNEVSVVDSTPEEHMLEIMKCNQEVLLDQAKDQVLIDEFQNLLKDNNNYYYFRAMGVIFEDPEEINLEYLLYNGLLAKDRQDQSEYTDSEVAFLKDYAKNSTWRDESAWVNAHKMPRQYLNDVLVEYFGVALEDLDIPEKWTYFEETDSYYVIRSDAYGVAGFTVTDVQTDENGLIYVYWTVDKIMDTRSEEIKFINEPQMVMVLEEREDGIYRIHLNLPVEELLDTSDEEYFQNLLTSQNGFWYWRAMGCVFENAEDIDMTLLCYGGMEERILYSTFTDDEIEFLKSRYPANDFDDSPWSNAHKLPRQELEDVMLTYFGVSLDDVSIPWVYYEETDAYYHVKYDSYGLVGYTVTDVDYHDDGTVSVYWHVPFGLLDRRDPENVTSLNEADMLLTLKDNGDGTYTVLSNLPLQSTIDREYFEQLLKGDEWYGRIIGCVFEEPEDISLYYLFYNGLPYEERQNSSDFTDSEVAFLKDVAVNSSWRDESVWVNAHKMPRQYISDVLNDYFGLTPDDVTIPEEWSYFEETDSYYYIRSDGYGVNGFTVTGVQTDENGLIYVYWTANYIRDTRYEEMTFINEPKMVMVLEERQDGGYLILSNQPVE